MALLVATAGIGRHIIGIMDADPTASHQINWVKLPWCKFWPLLKKLECPKTELGRSIASRIVIGDKHIIIKNYKETLEDVHTLVRRTPTVGTANSGMNSAYSRSKINNDDMRFDNRNGFGNSATTVDQWLAYKGVVRFMFFCFPFCALVCMCLCSSHSLRVTPTNTCQTNFTFNATIVFFDNNAFSLRSRRSVRPQPVPRIPPPPHPTRRLPPPRGAAPPVP